MAVTLNCRQLFRAAIAWCAAFAVVGVTSNPAHADARLTVRLYDASTGLPTAARLALRGPDGFLFAAPDAQLRTHETEGTGPFVHVADSLVMELPLAQYKLFAVRGTTGQAITMDINLVGNLTVDLQLADWIDARLSGWYSGDAHVHLAHELGAIYPPTDLDQARVVGRAEGLDLMFLLQNEAAHPGGPVEPPGPGVTLVHGEEFRNGFWGHTVVLGLDELLTFEGDAGSCGQFDPAWPTLTSILGQDTTGVHILAHPHTVDTPADSFTQWPGAGFARERAALALGDRIHAIAVASGSNSPDTWALTAYLDALRVGARWAAVGESDCALDRYYLTPPGQPRTFVQVGTGWVPGDPDLAAAWQEGLRQGRSFASTGPVISSLSVDGVEMGQTLVTTVGSTVEVEIAVSAATALRKVILHGATGVHTSISLSGPEHSFATVVELRLEHDDFVVLEVQAEASHWPHAHEAPRAVSSPVWIDTGVDWPLDPLLLRRQIDDLENFWQLALTDRGFLAPADSAAAHADILGAAAFYEGLVDDPPGAFALVAPDPLALIVTEPVVLRWTRSRSYDLESVTYRVEVATDPGFTTPWVDTVTADTFLVLEGLPVPETFHWRVHALEPGDGPVAAADSPRAFWYSGGVVAAPPADPGSVFMSRPTRAGGGFDLRLRLTGPEPVTLRWVDVRGRELGRRAFGSLPAGSHDIRMEAHDDRGAPFASGVYWLVATAGEERAIRRVIWVR